MLASDSSGRADKTRDHHGSLIIDNDVLVLLVTRDSNVSYADAGVTALLGVTPDDVVGSSLAALLHPDETDRVLAMLRDVGDRIGCRARFQSRAKDVAGGERWLEVVLSNRLDDPAIGAIVVNARDVTARHDAEQALFAEVRSATFSATIGRALVVDEPIDDVLAVCAHAALGMGCSAAYIWTVSDDETSFDLRAAAPRDADPAGASIPISSVAGDWSAATWTEVSNVTDRRASAQPLVNGDRLVGVIMAFADDGLTDAAVRALRLAASQIAIAIDHRRATDELGRMVDQLAQANVMRSDLIRHLVLAQEEERRVLAADIHDDSIQQMAATAMRLGVLRPHVATSSGRDLLARVEENVSAAVQRLRTLIFNMRPPSLDESGLVAALRDQLEVVAKDASFDWVVNARIGHEPPIEVAANAFRIAQEALMNVSKHADARNVVVDVDEQDGGLLVRIRDDGRGFEMNDAVGRRGHIGVSSMRERAELAGGWCTIDSQVGAGTTVSYWLPAA